MTAATVNHRLSIRISGNYGERGYSETQVIIRISGNYGKRSYKEDGSFVLIFILLVKSKVGPKQCHCF